MKAYNFSLLGLVSFYGQHMCAMTAISYIGISSGSTYFHHSYKNMRTKRLETPRVKVPKGSVGLTEQFANIYTFESPGGWNIIGNTPLKIFDNTKEQEPNLINPGDIIIFNRINLDQYNEQKLF